MTKITIYNVQWASTPKATKNRVVVLVFRTSSLGALYFCKVSRKDLKRVSNYSMTWFCYGRTNRPLQSGDEYDETHHLQWSVGHNSESKKRKKKRKKKKEKKKTELWFLCSARHLIVLYISVKFREKISNGFQDTERTWYFCDGETDRLVYKSYGSCALHVVLWCYIFVYSFMKTTLMVSKLQSGNEYDYFQCSMGLNSESNKSQSCGSYVLHVLSWGFIFL